MLFSKEKLKNFFRCFFLINDTPEKIAGGAALGIFLGIVPGAGLLAALILSSLFRLNRLATLTMAAAVNTWISFFILPAAAALGGFLFKISPADLVKNFQENYQLGWKTFLEEAVFFDLLLPLLVGFFLISAVIAFFVFLIFYFVLSRKKIRYQ